MPKSKKRTGTTKKKMGGNYPREDNKPVKPMANGSGYKPKRYIPKGSKGEASEGNKIVDFILFFGLLVTVFVIVGGIVWSFLLSIGVGMVASVILGVIAGILALVMLKAIATTGISF